MYNTSPRYNPDLEEDPECADCGKVATQRDPFSGAFRCTHCQEEHETRRAEAAEERWIARFHGGDTPQTLDERHEQAWRQKREGR